MSKSISRMLLSCAVAATAVALPAASQAPAPNDQETTLTLVHDFLQTFYPELSKKKLKLTFSESAPMDDSWREIHAISFTVKTPPHLLTTDVPGLGGPTIGQSDAGVESIVMDGYILFTRSGRLVDFGPGDSEIVHAKENADFCALAKSHPEWSKEETIRALKDAGARYGPGDKQRFIGSLQLDKFEPYMGKLTIKTVQFEGPLGDPGDPWTSSNWDNGDALGWVVDVDSEWAVGKVWAYTMFFEPFEGKLTGIIHGKLVMDIAPGDDQ